MIRVKRSHLNVVAETHPGMTGKNNEDRFAVSAYRLDRGGRLPSLFAVLSDGIGGHRAGEVAAELAVEHISQAVADSSGKNPVETLSDAVERASQEIYAHAQANPERQGMGATCACAWIINDRLYTATVGDSRIYLIRDGAIKQVTTDHTWIQEALDKGVLKPEEAHGNPNAHVIRRYLGSPTPPKVDFRRRLVGDETDRRASNNQGTQLLEQDLLLICSDGLTDLVKDQEILACAQKYSHETLPKALIGLANPRGGLDNITVIAIQVPKDAFRKPVPVAKTLYLTVLALLLVAAIGAWWFFGAQAWASLTGRTLQTATATATLTTSPAATLELTTTPSPGFAVTPLPTANLPGSTAGTPAGYPPPAGEPTLTPWPTNTLKP